MEEYNWQLRPPVKGGLLRPEKQVVGRVLRVPLEVVQVLPVVEKVQKVALEAAQVRVVVKMQEEVLEAAQVLAVAVPVVVVAWAAVVVVAAVAAAVVAVVAVLEAQVQHLEEAERLLLEPMLPGARGALPQLLSPPKGKI